MKKTILLLFLLNGFFCMSQILIGERVLMKAKQKVIDRTEQKGDEAVDKTLDKVEEGIGGVFKKKGKKSAVANKIGDNGYQSRSGNGATPKSMPDFSAYKAFDFVPGEKILFFEDFLQSTVGMKPKGWDGNAQLTTATDTETGH
ncbi:MAG: hypothetical protein ACK5L7_09805 [Paludibacteraceae bacterium]